MLLLLAVILRKHRTWSHCPLRVFCVCSNEDMPDMLHDTVTKFLYDMRIPATLKVVRNLMHNLMGRHHHARAFQGFG